MSDLNVYQKLSAARVALQKQPLKKTGYNSQFGKYFELADFLPQVNEIFNEMGLCSVFRIEEPFTEIQDGHELVTPALAKLTVINSEKPGDAITFSSEIAGTGQKGAPIQQIGSIHTYMRRYLWISCMEITESDAVDAQTENKPKKNNIAQKAQKRATEEQIKMIRDLFAGKDERLASMMGVYKISDLSELTTTQANAIISRMEKDNKDGNA